ENDADYQKVVKLIEPISFAEYIMTHCFCGAGDWPDNNWYFLMCNNPEKPGFFQMWDAEKSLAAYGNDGKPHAWYSPLLTEYDSRGGRAVPSRVWKAMISNPDFRMTFADVVYANLYNNGPLTNENAKERWLSLNNYLGYSNQDSAAIIGEAARWGDINSNLKKPPASYSVWHKAVADVANALDKNVEIFENEFREVLPELKPPVLLNDDQNITNAKLLTNSSLLLKMFNPNNEGEIYFSIDGIDPRIFGGADRNMINSSAQKYSSSFSVQLANVIKARVHCNGKWSALSEVKLNYNLKLAITELMYNPPSVDSLQSKDMEFVELKNVGIETVNLRNCKFEEGILYEFKTDCILDPGQLIVLASNLNVFKKIYPCTNVFDKYSGNLSNNGERIVLTDQVGNTLAEVSYDDDLPWPVVADGNGFSLVPINKAPYDDQLNWENWRASCSIGGSPGYDDPECLYSMKVRINEILTNPASGSSERIELYNEDVNNIDISGWYISSDKSQPNQFKIPQNTFLKSDNYVAFRKQDLIGNDIFKKENLFNATGGEIYLFETNKDEKLTGFSNGQYYGPQLPGVSFGSYEISTGEKHFVAQDENTFGMENSYPLVGPIVISKLMYHDSDSENEFIYLNNISQNVVCLYDELYPDNTWKIDGIDFIFPPYVKISPQSYLVLTNQNPEEFKTKGSIPSEINVFQYQGRLSNSGESLKLLSPVRTKNSKGLIETQYIQIDRIDYDDKAPWPTEADGSGYFLQREELEDYGNDPSNWTLWPYSQILTEVNQIVDTPNLDVAIYPNPANDYLIIHFNHEIQKDYMIEIRNQSGFLIYKQHIGPSDQNEIKLELLYPQSGIYYAVVRGNNYLKVEKVIFL
ncbi:MAG: lamin tail domain-containing protein, partial [Bacteroidales bacterium]|nr:lamin tail domain-containing protein [Bacteroidales bacterium]